MIRYKLPLILKTYDHCMQKVLTTSTPIFDIDLAHQDMGTALDFIQNTKSKGFVLATLAPHLIVLGLLVGAVFLYS